MDRLWVLNASFFKQKFLSLKSLAFPLSSHTESLLSRFTQCSLVSKGGIFKHPEREDFSCPQHTLHLQRNFTWQTSSYTTVSAREG